MEQPGGVSRFTIALNGAFCFRTYPLLRISWYRGVPFWNPFIWWPKIRPLKITVQFCALFHRPLHIRRGVPNFGETQSITVTPPGCFSLEYIFVTLRKC